MITLNEISHLLTRCSYKPGSTFSAEPAFDRKSWDQMSSSVMVHISLRVKNIKNSLDTFVRGSFKLEVGELEIMTEEEFLERLRAEIVRSEEHEIDEWFLVDGNCYQEPHPEMRGKTKWFQKPKNTDQSLRDPRTRDQHSRSPWPDFAPTPGEMVKPEDVTFPYPELTELEKNRRMMDLLDGMDMATRSDLMTGTPTQKEMREGLLVMDESILLKEEPPELKKIVKWNIDPILGTKIRRPKKG